jgi:hypothetical protein
VTISGSTSTSNGPSSAPFGGPIAGGVQVTVAMTYELEGGTKPACVAEGVFRYYA